MTTIKVSVKNKSDANLLIRMLKKVTFVDRIEEITDTTSAQNQVQQLQLVLDEYRDLDPFAEIQNPSHWQKKIREEWDQTSY
jgi:hypothetical protein